MQVVKSFTAEERESRQFSEAIDASRRSKIRSQRFLFGQKVGRYARERGALEAGPPGTGGSVAGRGRGKAEGRKVEIRANAILGTQYLTRRRGRQRH